jgi:glycosyltransferase involved in cell wall biosynthesis
MSPKTLVLTTEPLPIPGLATTGAGLRAWGLALGLRSAGVGDVVVAFAADAARGREIPKVPGVATFERAELDDFIVGQAPDSIVFQHWGLMASMKRAAPCPVAIDLAGPHLLERQLWGSARPGADLQEKLHALSLADHVVCSGRFQRHYFLPFLVQAGHNPRELQCPVIPFSASPDLPDLDSGRDMGRFLYAGMFLPWQDPERAIRAVLSTLEERGRGQLVFVGGPHPAGDVSGGRFDALLQLLEGHPLVERHPVLPFDALLRVMRSCAVAVDLMPSNAERELAFPTRTITYLWAGLPVIHNNYDELAEPIERAKAGWTFDPSDEEGVKRLVGRLLGHREDIERRSINARKLVQENYTWDKTIHPLAEWCRDPRMRAGKRPPIIALSEPPTTTEAAASPVAPSRKRERKTIHYSPPAPSSAPAAHPWYLSPLVFLVALPVSAILLLLFGMAEFTRLLFRQGRG